MGRKMLWLLLLGCEATTNGRVAEAQDLQLHYDWRHSVDPRNNARNFPELTFKSFKALEFGSFLIKLEANLDGSQHNVSKGYLEVSQTLRFWTTPIYAQVEYTGGLGVFDGASGGYYLENAYLFGGAYPFKWQGSWGNAYLAFKHTNFPRPSHDPQASLYWGKGFRERGAFASTGVLWTQNKNHGDAVTVGQSGKRLSFLVENEIWWRVAPLLSVGSEIRISRDVYAADGRLLIYPTVGVRYLF
jgi:hypothetical protein